MRVPTIALLGCGGSAATAATVAIPTATTVPVLPVVENLTKRVEASLASASQGNWLEVWEY